MFVANRIACKKLGLHANTLRKLADDNKIPHYITESEQRRYNVEAYMGEKREVIVICYCHVSSYRQKEDLAWQVAYMQDKYESAEIIKDIGSGLSYKRKGLKSVLERSMSGQPIKLVVAHRD
jgi:predicted site-specific integrase-resolvase